MIWHALDTGLAVLCLAWSAIYIGCEVAFGVIIWRERHCHK